MDQSLLVVLGETTVLADNLQVEMVVGMLKIGMAVEIVVVET